MADEIQPFFTASCSDLMLAPDCVSDLKSASFRGSISVRPSEAADVLQGKTLQGSGSDIGGSAGRGILADIASKVIYGIMLTVTATMLSEQQGFTEA